MKIKLTDIDIENKVKRSKTYSGNSIKENVDIKRESVGKDLKAVQSELKHELFDKTNIENTLNGLKISLENKKKEIEMLKNQKMMRIPPQFLASEKLAMNKKKYSPKKLGNISFKSKRSVSASK